LIGRVAKPKILLVPTVTEVEWKIKPLLEEWAEVASFDAPGVGAEPMTEPTIEAIVARGLDELDRRGWDRCVVVGDEVGAAQAARLASERPSAARALVMGHPALDFNAGGRRPTLNPEVRDVLVQIARNDFRSYVRALSQVTQDAFDEELADEYMARASQPVTTAYVEEFFTRAERVDLLPLLRGLTVPMLLVEHAGCLMWTREGFEDAIAALPEAIRTSVDQKPSVSPAFATVLKDFVEGLPA
jgi:pimeloyl-ACP methyl ester carboxylesterase